MNQFTVIKDSREQKGWNFDVNQYCTGTIIQKLDTGDYSLVGKEKEFVIERKATVSELANNILEERFIHVLERLSEYKSPHIILEFSLHDILSYPFGNSGVPISKQNLIKIRGGFILKKISEFHRKYGVPFWFADVHGEELALSLFKGAAFGK